MRRLFIIRKDLGLSPGKLAAMVAHCAEAYWLRMIQRCTKKVIDNRFPCVVRGEFNRKRQWYRRGSLDKLSKEAFEAGEDFFFASQNENGVFQKDPEAKYHYETMLDVDQHIYEEYIKGSIVKTICEAKNLNKLLKAGDKAAELGLIEEKDYGLIRDKCLTELTPENEDGTTTVGIWFKPLPDDISREISQKYQLYRGL